MRKSRDNSACKDANLKSGQSNSGSTSTSTGGQKRKFSVRFISLPTADTRGTTLQLIFDHKRYTVGQLCEGTQRAYNQVGLRHIKNNWYFLTGRTRWENTGGLVGMILTMAGAITSQRESAEDSLNVVEPPSNNFNNSDNVNLPSAPTKHDLINLRRNSSLNDMHKLHVFGAKNLVYTVTTCRRFVFRKGIPLVIKEFAYQDASDQISSPNYEYPPTWMDDTIKVWALVCRSRPSPVDVNRATCITTKRPLEQSDVTDDDDTSTSSSSESKKRVKSNNEFYANVVANMFDSCWHEDNLHEVDLRSLSTPAKLFIRDTNGVIVDYTGDTPWTSQDVPDIKVLTRKPWPASLVSHLPSTRPNTDCVSYIFQTFPQRGTFLPQKAKELKVPRGRLWGNLAAGESVYNQDSQLITPDMVMTDGRPGTGIAVLDIPNISYINELLQRGELKSEGGLISSISMFVWILGSGLYNNPQILEFMKLHNHAKHYVSSVDVCPNDISLNRAFTATYCLSKLDPVHFQVPIYDNVNIPQRLIGQLTPTEPIDIAHLNAFFTVPQRGLEVVLQPKFKVIHEKVIPSVNEADINPTISHDVQHRAEMSRHNFCASPPSFDPCQCNPDLANTEIITLGTGSSMPSQLRNVSATLIRVPNVGAYLLDCGENTLGQMCRMFGDEVDVILRDLRMIWISHLHADHHLGVTAVIKAWSRVRRSCQSIATPTATHPPRLAIISEIGMLNWIHEYACCDDLDYSHLALIQSCGYSDYPQPTSIPSDVWSGAYRLYINKANDPLQKSCPLNMKPLGLDALNTITGLSNIESCQVNHCHGAQAVALTWPNGLKIAYSGDCRPSKTFSRMALGSTVCIHEATFMDSLIDEARSKKHCTMSEAIKVSRDMKASVCLLTHFSQRYPNLPVSTLDQTSSSSCPTSPIQNTNEPTLSSQNSPSMVIVFAFDFMRVKIRDFPLLAHLYPLLQQFFESNLSDDTDDVTI